MNRESERKRLVELLKHECDVDGRYDGEGNCPGCKYNGMEDCSLQELADHLLNNGIVVPPCKVGQTVYIITEVSKTIWEGTVIGIWQCASNTAIITEIGTIHNDSLGKTVFLTREEAEKMLKGSKNNG